MSFILYEYAGILVFLAISVIISNLILALAFLFAPKLPNTEKLSVYECGFDAFEDARNTFDIRFYLVAILFLIFDLEISFLFPWSVTLRHLTMFGFWSMVVFLYILTVGFVYEWKKGALDWS